MLIADTVRAHRLAAAVWIVFGAGFMLVIGYGYVEEVESYPGGASAMGAALDGSPGDAVAPLAGRASRHVRRLNHLPQPHLDCPGAGDVGRD